MQLVLLLAELEPVRLVAGLDKYLGAWHLTGKGRVLTRPDGFASNYSTIWMNLVRAPFGSLPKPCPQVVTILASHFTIAVC